jgi:hypothetical protein
MLGTLMSKYRRHPILFVSSRIIALLFMAYVVYAMLQQRHF